MLRRRLPEFDHTVARNIAERIRKHVEERSRHSTELQLVTVSVGVVTCARTSSDIRGDALISAADGATYSAKCAGRNRICCVAVAGETA